MTQIIINESDGIKTSVTRSNVANATKAELDKNRALAARIRVSLNHISNRCPIKRQGGIDEMARLCALLEG